MDLGLSVSVTNIPVILPPISSPPSGPLVTSIQEYSVVFNPGNKSELDIITSVDKDLSCIFWGGVTSSIGGLDNMDDTRVRVKLQDSIRVRADRTANSANNETIFVKGYVVEFNSDFVTKVHHDTLVVSGTTSAESSPIVANLADCVVVWCGEDATSIGNQYDRARANLQITGSDGAVTVTCNKKDGTDALEVSFAIIEFVAAKINNIQEVIVNLNSPASTAITAVDLDKTLTIWGGNDTQASGTNWSGACRRATLTDDTTLAYGHGPTPALCQSTYTMIEFNDAVFTSVERETPTMGNSETTDNVTLGTELTDTSLAFISNLGYSSGTDSTYSMGFDENTTLITSTTNVERVRVVPRNAASQTGSYDVYQVAP